MFYLGLRNTKELPLFSVQGTLLRINEKRRLHSLDGPARRDVRLDDKRADTLFYVIEETSLNPKQWRQEIYKRLMLKS